MTEKDRDQLIQETVLDLVGPSRNALLSGPHLDVSRPNIHDNKRDFLRELAAVQTALDGARGTVRALLPGDNNPDAETKAMIGRLESAIDDRARRSRPRLPLNTATDLVRRNMADTGLFFNSLLAFLDLIDALEDRLNELKDQEKQYWAVNHRPANHFARAIALRLARLYSREKGIKPTFGTARDGGHPSTDYGRALERIFAALGIQGSVRNPAKWAIDQLTEEDLRPATINMLGGLLGFSPGQLARLGHPKNAMLIVDALTRRSEETTPSDESTSGPS